MDWIDAEGIKTLDQAETCLRSRAARERLLAAAARERRTAVTPPALPARGKNLVAGTGQDLSSLLGCGATECMVSTVDSLVLRAWAYFDHIIVVGADPVDVLQIFQNASEDEICSRSLTHIAVALHVRSIGAEDYFMFRRKDQICVDHLDQHAEEAGLGLVSRFVDPLTEVLAVGYQLDFKESQEGLRYFYRHPALVMGRTGVIKKEVDETELARHLAHNQAQLLVAGLTRSALLARESNAALGQSALTTAPLADLPNPQVGSVSSADVALDLELPILRGAKPADLLRIRGDDPGEFEIFRAALTKTIEERIRALPNDQSARVAASVVEDVLDPAMAMMSRKMRRSVGLLGKRSAATVVAGGVATSVGLLAMAPLAIPGVVLAAGALVASYNEYLKDRRDLEVSDLHFLWRADKSLHA